MMNQSPDFLSTTLSPQRARNAKTDRFTSADDVTTNDQTRQNAYQSAQKIRLAKKSSVEAAIAHHNMSATIHTTEDVGQLPNVRGASKSKRTVM